jgi:hypothetical protein
MRLDRIDLNACDVIAAKSQNAKTQRWITAKLFHSSLRILCFPLFASRSGVSCANARSILRKSVRGLARRRCSTFMNLEHLVRFQVETPESGMR